MKKFMIAALAAGMLTACSDSAVVETPAGGGAQWGADGTGYVSLNISLPSSAVGRANDKFDDGLASEYKVKDAVLVLFKGATEDAATFVDAYKLPINFSATEPDQITSTSKITKRINAIDGDQQVYALVLLNAVSNGLFSVNNKPEQEEYKTSEAKINLDGGPTDLAGKTFATVKTYIATLPIDINKGLIMLNAPLTDVGSTSANPPSGNATILAQVDRNKIKPTASEAAAAPAAEIYVERNSAKVTLEAGNLTSNTEVGNIPYQVKGIALDNTNTKSYIVRNVEDWATWRGLTSASKSLDGAGTRYRFAAAAAVKTGTPLYRIYWAKDVNYHTNSGTTPIDVTGWNLPGNGITTEHEIAQFSTSFTPAPATGYSDPLYCLENTFDVVNMDWSNTTRAILKVHFGTEAEDVDMVMWNNDAATFQKHTAAIAADGPMAKAIAGMSEFKAAYDGKTKADISVTIAHEGTDPENVYRLASITVAGAGGGNVATDSELFKAAKEYFGAISYYVGGMGYYQVRIKHFMDDLTPWNITGTNKEWNTEAPKAGYVDKVYPGLSAENYLGRYGVVRNNWYNLKVTRVKIIGTPYIENITTDLNKFTPDDEMKTYITVNINILSWAKRDQGVILE